MTERNPEIAAVPRSLGATLVAASLLAGCSLIPAYERPAAPVPQPFGADQPGAAPALPARPSIRPPGDD